jgi:hypothetical protein
VPIRRRDKVATLSGKLIIRTSTTREVSGPATSMRRL